MDPSAAPAFPARDTVPAPPRSWFAIVMVGLYWAVTVALDQIGIPTFVHFLSRVITGLLLLILFVVWWLRRRQVSRAQRWLGIAVAVAAGLVAGQLADRTLDAPRLLLMGVPCLITAWALWWMGAQNASPMVRGVGLYVVLCLAWSALLVFRADGLDGNLRTDLRWRWSPTAEDLYLADRAQRGVPAAAPASAPPTGAVASAATGDWPEFRGPQRDSAVRGAIDRDWTRNPPKPLWRQRIGAGWSSMAIVGRRLYTQEQRGEVEAVVCLDALNGGEIWAHTDPERCWDSQSGLGPRATPTVTDGRVYALGGTGVLNCLDAASGERRWFRRLTADTTARMPQWGFASSPLVTGGLVIVFAGGAGPGTLLAYHADTGEPAWTAAAGRGGYGSAQIATICGVPQVVFFSDAGLFGFDPPSGRTLWTFAAAGPGSPRAVQPQVLDGDRVLIASQMDIGASLVEVTRAGGSWTATPRWRSHALNPFYNNFVVHDGFAYGFDGGILCCADLKTGQRRWKEGRYDYGQVLLLADVPALLVLAEQGEAVLVAANPERLEELGRFQALSGKTWNHPAIAGGRLYVRNAEEIACYQLGVPAAH